MCIGRITSVLPIVADKAFKTFNIRISLKGNLFCYICSMETKAQITLHICAG